MLNDYRPIALTPLLSKCMERLVRRELSSQTAEFMDPMQFAHQSKGGVATLTILNKIFSHLDKASPHVRILFMDFFKNEFIPTSVTILNSTLFK